MTYINDMKQFADSHGDLQHRTQDDESNHWWRRLMTIKTDKTHKDLFSLFSPFTFFFLFPPLLSLYSSLFSSLSLSFFFLSFLFFLFSFFLYDLLPYSMLISYYHILYYSLHHHISVHTLHSSQSGLANYFTVFIILSSRKTLPMCTSLLISN
jgi:hypothetical protein